MIGEDGSENRRLRPSRGSPSGCQEEDRVVGSARGLRASHRRRESVREFPGPFAPLRDFSRTLRPFRSPAMPLDFWRTLIISGLKWSEWRDSNPRPLVPQTSALTGLRYTPTALLIGAVAAPCNAALDAQRVRTPARSRAPGFVAPRQCRSGPRATPPARRPGCVNGHASRLALAQTAPETRQRR